MSETGLVTAVGARSCRVHLPGRGEVRCTLRGLLFDDESEAAHPVAAGDHVSVVLAGLDPVLFQLEDVCSEVGSLRLAAPCSGATFAGLTPARIWPSESIGEPELAAFAAAVLRVNEEALRLPLPVSRLQYRDTAVADGAATVRFADRDSGELALAVEFGASGEVSSIERLAGDRSTKLR